MGELLFGLAQDQVQLMGAQAVRQGVVLRLLGHADAAEPVSGCAAAICVVVNERVLGGQAALGLIKLRGSMGGCEESFQQ